VAKVYISKAITG